MKSNLLIKFTTNIVSHAILTIIIETIKKFQSQRILEIYLQTKFLIKKMKEKLLILFLRPILYLKIKLKIQE